MISSVWGLSCSFLFSGSFWCFCTNYICVPKVFLLFLYPVSWWSPFPLISYLLTEASCVLISGLYLSQKKLTHHFHLVSHRHYHLKCLKPNWPLSSQMCFFSEVPWSHRCNSLYLLSWRSNRKVVFEISSAYRFSHIGAFLVLYHYVSWIYHFFFGFVDLGVRFMSTTITRFLDGGS